MFTAVEPVTSMVLTPNCFSMAGARARSSWTRSAVAGSVWPPGGITWIRAVSAPASGVDCGTATTPGTALIALARSLTVPFGSELVMMSAVTARGAL